MKLILFSDLHLDAPFKWAGPRAGHKLRQDIRNALARILELADEVGAEAILCGGDLYEHDRFTPDTGQFLRSMFEAAHPLSVYISPGNHDWHGTESLYRRIEWSPNVHVFGEDELRAVQLKDGITLWGAAHRVPANTDNFLDRFEVDRSGVNLALFHGSEKGGFSFQGPGKRPHASFDAFQIENSGLDHAFLGHYHRPCDAGRFTYPGNPAPLNFGEDGARGAVIAEVRQDGAINRDRRSVAGGEFFDLDADLTGCSSTQEVRERIRETLRSASGVARVTLEGELGAEIDLRLGDLSELAPHVEAVVPKIGNLSVGYDFDAIAAEQTVRGQFVADALASDLPEEERKRILATGLRALDGRKDLEVF